MRDNRHRGHNRTSREDGQHRSSETQRQSTIDEDLTVDERDFLCSIVATVNRQHPNFDLLESMAKIRDSFDEVNIPRLKAWGYLEEHTELRHVYYTVTRAGQEACGMKVRFGERKGDLHEKTLHKVMVEAFARTIRADQTRPYFVTTYAPLIVCPGKPDVSAYDNTREWTGTHEPPEIIGEAITNVRPDLIVKHYDDYNHCPMAKKVWIVANKSAAWDVVRALANAGRIDRPPKRSLRSYRKLTEAIWSDDHNWSFVSAMELMDSLA